MKKYSFFLFLLLILFNLSAQESSVLEGQINFDLTLKDLVVMVESGRSNDIDMNQYLILDGVVSSREVLFADEENFIGMLEVSYGEWEGLENVAMYRCYIQLQGLEYAPMIPLRRSRRPNPAEISLNTRILVVSRYLGYSEDENGKKYPVLECVKIRKIN